MYEGGPTFSIDFVTASEAASLRRMIDNNPDVLQGTDDFFSWLGTPEGMRSFVLTVDANRTSGNVVAFAITVEDEAEGLVLLVRDRLESALGELSFWISARYRRRRMMTRAIEAVMSHAFRHLAFDRVEIRCSRDNTACASLAQRLGPVDVCVGGAPEQEEISFVFGRNSFHINHPSKTIDAIP